MNLWEKTIILWESRQHEHQDEPSLLRERRHHHDCASPDGNAYDRHTVNHILGKVLGMEGAFVDVFSRSGIFLRAFKKALSEKSDYYPFLHPLKDCFGYRGGEIFLDEGVGLESPSADITESFDLTMSYLHKEFAENMIMPPPLQSEIERLLRGYQDIAKGFRREAIPFLLSDATLGAC